MIYLLDIKLYRYTHSQPILQHWRLAPEANPCFLQDHIFHVGRKGEKKGDRTAVYLILKKNPILKKKIVYMTTPELEAIRYITC